ncbi:hypothetical protein GcM3_096025 [Golovinomyces cichoracearum]|uniref:Uncharacterized protein n=1 Tax=Golovinomyces cichoracearum TaxID=62708 RepID=A0A420IEF3_9PEZI|nr:hypothetical protein GcM3_096025 [Golovinomyces cichoracearum]
MDTKIHTLAEKFNYLIESKHQYARAIDALTRQLVQLIISQSIAPASADSKKISYSPTKENFQVDLYTFAHLIYRQLTSPPPPSPQPTATEIGKAVLDMLKDTRTKISNTDKNVDRVLENMDFQYDQMYQQSSRNYDQLIACLGEILERI